MYVCVYPPISYLSIYLSMFYSNHSIYLCLCEICSHNFNLLLVFFIRKKSGLFLSLYNLYDIFQYNNMLLCVWKWIYCAHSCICELNFPFDWSGKRLIAATKIWMKTFYNANLYFTYEQSSLTSCMRIYTIVSVIFCFSLPMQASYSVRKWFVFISAYFMP